MSEHGGNIYDAARRTGIPEETILDFSASINPMGLPKGAAQAIRRGIQRLYHYPEPNACRLAARIAGSIQTCRESVICGNGSTELIYLIPRVLQPARALILQPSFREYERACRVSGAERIVGYGLRTEDHFELSGDAFIDAISEMSQTGRPAVVFLCNPNNPTGRLVAKETVLRIAEAAASVGCYLIVDEAFIDYCQEESVAGAVADNPFLVVIRSLTKFYALAGLRIGYAVVHPDLAARIRACKEPWTVNSLAQAAAMEALDDRPYQQRSRDFMKDEKVFLENGLAGLHIDYLPSRANYYLLRLEKAQTLRRALEERGILVRDCSNFAGLDDRYLRIAVRSRRENRVLLKEMADICARLS